MIEKLKQKIKIAKLKREAAKAKKRADYLNSPKGLAIETIKGMPEATKKIGRGIKKSALYHLGGGKYGEKMNERGRKSLEKWKEEQSWGLNKGYNKKKILK